MGNNAAGGAGLMAAKFAFTPTQEKPAQDGQVESLVRLLRAGGVGSNNPPTLTIEVHEQIGEVGSLIEARQLHARQAEMLANALLASLPGGTVDALLAELMRRRASLFSVPLEG